jgi:hypothetical protein
MYVPAVLLWMLTSRRIQNVVQAKCAFLPAGVVSYADDSSSVLTISAEDCLGMAWRAVGLTSLVGFTFYLLEEPEGAEMQYTIAYETITKRHFQQNTLESERVSVWGWVV